MGAIPQFFENAPNGISQYWWSWREFIEDTEIGQVQWATDGNTLGGGHDAPYTCTTGVDSGAVTMGSGSTNSGSYVQCQDWTASIVPTRLGKTYLWESQFSLSSASLTGCIQGMFPINSNLIGTNVANGFGAYANLSGGFSATNWTFFIANGTSGSQFNGLTPLAGPAVDTNVHTFGIRLITDGNNLGGGTVQFWWDGVQLQQYQSPTLNTLPQVGLASSFAMGNGSAAAQTASLYGIGVAGQR